MKNLKRLLAKEYALALHPTNLIFLALSAMLIIPDYPYYVTFFYTSLGVFFVCLTGRENHDLEYSAMLPIRKRDIVRGRVAFAISLELLQFVCAIPFAFLRQTIMAKGNAVGMDANIAFFGFALVMVGLFNLVFFTRYYAAPDKVGSAFLVGSVVEFLYMMVAEVLAHAVPFVRDRLDTPDPQFLGEKLAVLGAGLAVFALLNALAIRQSQRKFEALDL